MPHVFLVLLKVVEFVVVHDQNEHLSRDVMRDFRVLKKVFLEKETHPMPGRKARVYSFP